MHTHWYSNAHKDLGLLPVFSALKHLHQARKLPDIHNYISVCSAIQAHPIILFRCKHISTWPTLGARNLKP